MWEIPSCCSSKHIFILHLKDWKMLLESSQIILWKSTVRLGCWYMPGCTSMSDPWKWQTKGDLLQLENRYHGKSRPCLRNLLPILGWVATNTAMIQIQGLQRFYQCWKKYQKSFLVLLIPSFYSSAPKHGPGNLCWKNLWPGIQLLHSYMLSSLFHLSFISI